MRTNETTTTYTCDRCGRKSTNPAFQERWATIFIQVDGVGDDETFPIGVGHKDICPSCIRSFRNWWKP